MQRCLALLLALAALATWPGALQAGGTGDPVERALEALGSPAERERLEAVAVLLGRLPEARARILQALPTAPPDVRLQLVDVLVHDGSDDAVRALLDVLRSADDALASRIISLLVRSPQGAEEVLSAWRREPSLRVGPDGKVSPRVEVLERLLQRVEVERIFLSRKSAFGTTGSYRGQYDELKPYRLEALALCADVLWDRAPAAPGVYPVGRFDFLRRPPAVPDMDELQSMAGHCFAELATRDDTRALLDLFPLLPQLRERTNLLAEQRYYSLAKQTEFDDALNRYADLVVAFSRIDAQRYARFLTELLSNLDLRGDWYDAYAPSRQAGVLLRAGRYAEAILEFDKLLALSQRGWGRDLVSPALTHYNMACAYAQWGEQATGRERTERRRDALRHLELAIDHHWAEVQWLDEDRDLDPLRDSDEFRRLRARMVGELTPLGRDGDPASGSRSGSRR